MRYSYHIFSGVLRIQPGAFSTTLWSEHAQQLYGSDRRGRHGRVAPCARSRAICALAAGKGALPTTIGGLSIPYAAIPINKSTGITIGGTRYFIGRSLVIITWRTVPPRGEGRRAT